MHFSKSFGGKIGVFWTANTYRTYKFFTKKKDAETYFFLRGRVAKSRHLVWVFLPKKKLIKSYLDLKTRFAEEEGFPWSEGDGLGFLCFVLMPQSKYTEKQQKKNNINDSSFAFSITGIFTYILS